MTAAEILPALEAIGVHLVLSSMGTLEAEVPDPTPPEVDRLLIEVRANRPAIIAALSSPPRVPCLDCRTALAEGVLLCCACLERRRGPGRLLRFDPDRRRRTAAALATARCSSCGGSWWGVNARGDAWCEPCRRRLANEPKADQAGTVEIDTGGSR